MTAPPLAGTAKTERSDAKRSRSAVLAAGLLAALGLLVLVASLSVALGARSVPLSTVLTAFPASVGASDHTVIRELRVPRTILGLGVGAALGLAGALMQ